MAKQDPAQRLYAVVRGAAANQFANIEAERLGVRLRELTDQVMATKKIPDIWVNQLGQFRDGLNQFEKRGRQDKSRVVAHGLRICMGLCSMSEPPPRGKVLRPSRNEGKGSRRSMAPVANQVSRSAPKSGNPSNRQTTTASPIEQELEDSSSGNELLSLPGVGAKTAQRLHDKGMSSIEDMLYLLPTMYIDRRRSKKIAEMVEGESGVIEGVIQSFRQGWARGRYIATMVVNQPGGDGDSGPQSIEAKWFHPTGMGSRVVTGQSIALAGTLKMFRGKPSMVHPELLGQDPDDRSIAVRYPIIEGVGQKSLHKFAHLALEKVAQDEGGFVDALPRAIANEYSLVGQFEALDQLHRPNPNLDEEKLHELQSGASPAHRRLAFDEFFFIQLASLRQRVDWQSGSCSVAPLVERGIDREELRACLPFEPTAAQWRVITEIEQDLQESRPMLRMVQGDVGSGKTAVAFAVALAVIRAGAQVTLMAPTEVLAAQHYQTLKDWCDRALVRVAILTGSTSSAERSSLLALLGAGRIDLLIGTHALLVGDVEFSRLGLAIVDEQHRFGVEQRAILRSKGATPHLLLMTATPIPRSLALAAFGELEVSVIDEMPPGRIPSETKVFAGKRALDQARSQLCKQVIAGNQAFVVCPLVEASEMIEASDVEATVLAFRQALPDVEIAGVHGRMGAAERAAAMARFREGNARILVATTVIEVGVDMPNARAILVEHAERFGLAQLHQLRGRVGRNRETSLCLLHTAHPPSSPAGQRLQILSRFNEGLQVAEQDLDIRGPGEVFGTRQSGIPRLRFASFRREGLRILQQARAAAKSWIAQDPQLTKHPEVAKELDRRLEQRRFMGADSG